MELEPEDEEPVATCVTRLRFLLPVVALRGVLREGVASDAVEMFNLRNRGNTKFLRVFTFPTERGGTQEMEAQTRQK